MPSRPSHYFDTSPTAPSSPQLVPLTLPDLSVDLRTDTGVFSGERVDPGTKYLLLDARPPSPEVHNVLDLGCGYGAIAVTLAHRAPAAIVWAVDVNERALSLCRANADKFGHGGRVHTSLIDEAHPFGAVPDHVAFDLIWSNPPIRVGKPALHDLLGRWLPRLAPNGHAVLVVQKHLGSDSLQRWLGEQGWAVTRLGSRAGYRLLDVAHRDQPISPS